MPKFVVEREIPGIGTWSADRLQPGAGFRATASRWCMA